jgi:hypothetical protein
MVRGGGGALVYLASRVFEDDGLHSANFKDNWGYNILKFASLKVDRKALKKYQHSQS